MNSNSTFTLTMNDLNLIFSIRKITNNIPKLLTNNITSTLLILNSFNADVDINNVVNTWRNINFKNLLGDDYELNALYNIRLQSNTFNETVVSTSNRVGTLEFSCNNFIPRYGNSNKWLIPLTYTNTTPNTRTFRGVFMNTFMLTSEQDDITINHSTQHFNTLDKTILLPEKILYFIINKI